MDVVENLSRRPWIGIALAAVLAAALLAGAIGLERASWAERDALYESWEAHERTLSHLEAAVVACDVAAMLSLAALLFLLLRPWGPEVCAAALLALAGLLYFMLLSFMFARVSAPVPAQRAQAVPLHLLAVASGGCFFGACALGFASRRVWVKIASVTVALLAVALAVWGALGS